MKPYKYYTPDLARNKDKNINFKSKSGLSPFVKLAPGHGRRRFTCFKHLEIYRRYTSADLIVKTKLPNNGNVG